MRRARTKAPDPAIKPQGGSSATGGRGGAASPGFGSSFRIADATSNGIALVRPQGFPEASLSSNVGSERFPDFSGVTVKKPLPSNADFGLTSQPRSLRGSVPVGTSMLASGLFDATLKPR